MSRDLLIVKRSRDKLAPTVKSESFMANALPDLKLLRIFASVVRHQGFATAQQELNLSTSAISTYMSQLEANLGLVLCHRGRGTALNIARPPSTVWKPN